MNPLAYADMNTDGKENIFGLFQYIAHDEFEEAVKKNEVVDPNLKTTSIRLHEKQLKVFDAVIRSFGLTRNEAFAYAITQFMADAISGYACGRAEAFGDANFEQSASDQRSAFLKSLPLDDELRSYLSSLTKYEFLKRIGVE